MVIFFEDKHTCICIWSFFWWNNVRLIFQIPASAVEMPGHMMTTLDVQFGNMEFSFGGNETVPTAFTSADTAR